MQQNDYRVIISNREHKDNKFHKACCPHQDIPAVPYIGEKELSDTMIYGLTGDECVKIVEERAEIVATANQKTRNKSGRRRPKRLLSVSSSARKNKNGKWKRKRRWLNFESRGKRRRGKRNRFVPQILFHKADTSIPPTECSLKCCTHVRKMRVKRKPR